MKKIPSIWNIPNEEEVWKKMFSKSRPGITLARSPVGIPRRSGRDIICDHCWPNDCGCR